MITCEICGSGFRSGKDETFYGCYICNKGYEKNREETRNLVFTVGSYSIDSFTGRQSMPKCYKRHSIPPELLEVARRGTQKALDVINR